MAVNRAASPLRKNKFKFLQCITALCLALAFPVANAWRIVDVEQQIVGSSSVLGGTVIPYKEVVLNAQMPGRVTFIGGSEGDSFTKNALLVALDDDELQAKRQAIQSRIYSADSALRNARAQYNRELWSPQSRDISRAPGMAIPGLFDNMFTKNFASMFDSGNPGLVRQSDLIQRGTGMNQAYAGFLEAQAGLAELDAKIRDTKSMAPFDGVIADKLVEVGDTVQPGQPLLKFAHIKYLRVKVDVPVRLVKNLRLKQMVPVRLDGSGKDIMARVSRIYPVADPSRHTVKIKLDLPTNIVAGPGMYARVKVPIIDMDQAVEVAVVPETAILHRGSLPSIFILNKEGVAEMRIVRTGERTDKGMVVISSGLSGNERIIDNPPPGIVSGWQPKKAK
ncbi:MAG: efflux RND transporter periplasmic adaptor subunit [Gammaproteobacteria bacterium]|nr:efflux RND transporter periplasmic adaptor subunit [Gammaproteobacteria bacterium]